jgi:hypothetical protein
MGDNAMSESRQLVRELLTQMTETIDQLVTLTDTDLGRHSDHVCAMNGDVRRLLVHNIEHERMHAGAISTARFEHENLPDSELAMLAREWLRQRVEVIGLLLGAPDAVLDYIPGGDEWTVRQQAEHLLYWERDSMNALAAEQAAASEAHRNE